MTKNIYTADVKVWATAYIVAESEEEAQKIADTLASDTIILAKDNDPMVTDCDIDLNMPELSLSPCATIESVKSVERWDE